MILTTAARPVRPLEQAKVTLRAHLNLLRLDHWVKHIFVVPGIVIAISITATTLDKALVLRTLLGLAAVIAAASSNYVLNELLDAPFDRQHPTKHTRPAACRSVNVPLAYVQWLVCAAIGFALALVKVSLLQRPQPLGDGVHL
jgi:4-hydroxybenzoate polyprenyltransferase